MTESSFGIQMDRLRSCFGPRFYEPIRIKLIWDTLRHQSERDFELAVTHCLQTLRSAPLLPELLKALEQVVAQKKQMDREMSLSRIQDPMGALREASQMNKLADPEFVLQCMKLIWDKNNGKITRAQFLEGCQWLDEAARLYK